VRANGEEVRAEREAADRFTLARELRGEGLTLVSASPRQALQAWRAWRFNRVSLKDKIVFANSMASMLGSGLSLTRALNVLERQATKSGWREVLESLSQRINAGESFSKALGAFPDIFPTFFVSMVAAGEESGKLTVALEGIRDELSKSYELRRNLRGAMIYPVIILVAIVVVSAIIVLFLLPVLTGLFLELEVDLPLSTRILIAISNFASRFYLFILLAMFGGVYAGWRFSRHERGRRFTAYAGLRLPVLKNLMRNFNSAMTLRTLSILIASGVGLVEALRLTQEIIINPYYRQILREGAEAVQKGKTLSSVLLQHASLYPPLATEMTQVGEETGNLAGMMERGAVFFEAEVAQTTKNLSAILEPVLMIIIGIIVGFFAFSVIGPIYGLMNSL
jgi:type II secretory pathway component PulF